LLSDATEDFAPPVAVETPAMFFMDLRLRLNKKCCVSKWDLQFFQILFLTNSSIQHLVVAA